MFCFEKKDLIFIFNVSKTFERVKPINSQSRSQNFSNFLFALIAKLKELPVKTPNSK